MAGYDKSYQEFVAAIRAARRGSAGEPLQTPTPEPEPETPAEEPLQTQPPTISYPRDSGGADPA